MRRPHVVILGAHAAGLMTVHELLPSVRAGLYRVTLVTSDDHHDPGIYLDTQFDLSITQPCVPLTDVVPREIAVLPDRVAVVNLRDQQLEFDSHQTLPYDHLVLDGIRNVSPVSHPNYQGFAYALKSRADQQRFREAFWRSVNWLRADSQAIFEIEIVGADQHGVALALSLARLRTQLEQQGVIGVEQLVLRLSDQAETILPGVSVHKRVAAEASLITARVHVQTSRLVDEYQLQQWRKIDNPFVIRLVVWNGVRTYSQVGLGKNITRNSSGRFVVDNYSRLLDFPRVWAVGDLGPQMVQNLALDGLAQGRTVAQNILRSETAQPLLGHDLRLGSDRFSRLRYHFLLRPKSLFRVPCQVCRNIPLPGSALQAHVFRGRLGPHE